MASLKVEAISRKAFEVKRCRQGKKMDEVLSTRSSKTFPEELFWDSIGFQSLDFSVQKASAIETFRADLFDVVDQKGISRIFWLASGSIIPIEIKTFDRKDKRSPINDLEAGSNKVII